MSKSKGKNRPRQVWSEADIAITRERYPHRPTKEVAAQLGRKIDAVYRLAYKLGLSKTAEFLASAECGILHKGETRPGSIPHRFPKGHVPANTGIRRPGWGPGRMKETQFVKGERMGQAARNWKPIGTIIVDTEGYKRIKIRENIEGEHSGFGNTKVWPLMSRYLWEQHKGPIPPKHLIKYIDKDRNNCVIENLYLVSMKDNMAKNTIWNTDNMPHELAEVILIAGALKRQIRRRKENGKKQDV